MIFSLVELLLNQQKKIANAIIESKVWVQKLMIKAIHNEFIYIYIYIYIYNIYILCEILLNTGFLGPVFPLKDRIYDTALIQIEPFFWRILRSVDPGKLI